MSLPQTRETHSTPRPPIAAWSWRPVLGREGKGRISKGRRGRKREVVEGEGR